MTTRWARFARGWFAAVFSTFVAASSHGFAGGGHPPLFAIALALAFSGIVCVFLAGVRLSRIRLSASVVVSQLLYHGLFSLFGTGAAVGTTPTAGGHHHAVTLATPSATPGEIVFAPYDYWMLVAHAAAAVLTIAVLLHGERLCLGLAALAGMYIAALLGRMPWSPTPTAPRLSTPNGARSVVPHKLAVLVSSLRHRGPPAVLRFA